MLVASLTSKGASTDASFSDNMSSFIESAHSYLIAPFVALSMQMSEFDAPALGEYSLRFFFSVLAALGLTNRPMSLVRGYEFTPAPTNLYTVYEVYVRDFAVFGFFLPVLFLPIHWYLYKKARRGHELYIIIYAISTYPLLTQVLQDQYMTLISTWIQLFIGCWLLISKLTYFQIFKFVFGCSFSNLQIIKFSNSHSLYKAEVFNHPRHLIYIIRKNPILTRKTYMLTHILMRSFQ